MDLHINGQYNTTTQLFCKFNTDKLRGSQIAFFTSKKDHSERAKDANYKKGNIEQIKATLNRTDFVKNPLNDEDITIHNIWSKPVGGFIFYKWIITGSAVIISLLLGSTLIYKICGKLSQSQNSTSFKVENNFTNNLPTCPQTTTAHTGTNPMDSKPPSYIDTEQLEIEKAKLAKKRWLEQNSKSN